MRHLYVAAAGGAGHCVEGVQGLYLLLFAERAEGKVDGFAVVKAPIHCATQCSGEQSGESESSSTFTSSTPA